MRRLARIAALLPFLAATPAAAEPDIYDAVLIKQYLVCEDELKEACEYFGRARFAVALSLFRLSANLGDARAQNNLGMHFESGAGVERDKAEAQRWFTKSAEAGISLAQYNLAMLLATEHILQQSERPENRDRDLSRAYMWLSLAARGGLELAITSKPEMASFLTAEQIEMAERLLRSR